MKLEKKNFSLKKEQLNWTKWPHRSDRVFVGNAEILTKQ